MLKKARKALKSNNGFTILELIVVIAIMGFLVALVAPRLVNVASSSKEPVAVTDMKRLTEVTERHIQETGNLPNDLNGLIPWYPQPDVDISKYDAFAGGFPGMGKIGAGIGKHNTADSWIWDGAKSDVSKPFLGTFSKRNNLYVHLLNKDEADEIKKLGITKLISLEDGKEIDVRENTKVLMIGAACNNPTVAGSVITPGSINIVANGDSGHDGSGMIWKRIPDPTKNHGEKYARPELIYRIILGIGDESELVQKGLIKSAGVHPQGLENKDSIKFKNYALVIPRLQSTIDRFESGKVAEKVEVRGLDRDGKTIVESREIILNKKQDISDFDIIGIGEEVYPTSDVYEWEVTKDPLLP